MRLSRPNVLLLFADDLGCYASAYADSMKKQATEVKFLNRSQYANWLKSTDDDNAALAKDLGLMRR